MRLQFIRLINFKQFYKEQYASFSTEDDLKVTVFFGITGTGKTSMFTAINWCLYGTGDENTGELFNKQALDEAIEGQKCPVVVSIGFRHKSIEYIAERVRYFEKQGQEAVVKGNEFTLTQIDSLGQTKLIGNPSGKLDSILPANVREYFFFNGEKMEDLTKPGNRKIEDAIKNIMRLPTIDRAQKHLQDITKEYRSEIQRKGSVKLDQLIKLQEQYENDIVQLKQEIKHIDTEVSKATKQVSELEALLEESREVGNLQTQRNQYNRQISRLEMERDNLAQSIFETVNKVYPINLANNAQKALQIINSQVRKGKIPSGIKEDFLKEIIRKGECICGRSFSAHDECYATLEALLNQTQPNEFEDSVMRLRGDITTLSRVTEERLANLKEKTKNYQIKAEDIEDCRRRVDDLSRRIGDVEEVNIENLESRREQFARSIKFSLQKRGQNEQKIIQLQNSIDGVIKERSEEEKKQGELRKLSNREAMARKSSEAITTIKERFYEETRKRIESETKLVFDKLAWKTDQFNEIRLDPEFHLEVIDRWNKPSREELSAGERQILSLSFIAAMARLSGEEAPVIMDTPFARLSGIVLQNVAEHLPDLLPQLILFVTDQEWSESSRSGLEPKVGAQYKFEFSDGVTTIKEVSFA
ncbi:MAG: AAA family ATPase [Clostridiaceae bacterium]|nr:AAA family ATPase [Clostridiaceae bacterium]